MFLGLLSCSEEKAASPDPLTSSRSIVRIIYGTLEIVEISGGTPPYHIIEHPLLEVATVSFEDSTESPANLLVRSSGGGVGDTTTMVVGDSDPLNQSQISITIQQVVDGVSYTGHIQAIWDIYCKNKGCHPGGDSPFSLDRSASFNNLYLTTVANISCGLMYRVKPFEPDSSLVYLLVSGKTSCPRMPFSQIPGDTLVGSDQLSIWT